MGLVEWFVSLAVPLSLATWLNKCLWVLVVVVAAAAITLASSDLPKSGGCTYAIGGLRKWTRCCEIRHMHSWPNKTTEVSTYTLQDFTCQTTRPIAWRNNIKCKQYFSCSKSINRSFYNVSISSIDFHAFDMTWKLEPNESFSHRQWISKTNQTWSNSWLVLHYFYLFAFRVANRLVWR